MFRAFWRLWTKPHSHFTTEWENEEFEVLRATNNITHLLHNKVKEAWVLIDPTLGTARGLKNSEWSEKNFVGVLITHPHIDHTADVYHTSKLLSCPVYCTEEQRHMLRLGSYTRDIWGMVPWWMKGVVLPVWIIIKSYIGNPAVELIASNGSIPDIGISYINVGGHSPGDVVIHGPGFVFLGDLALCVTQRKIFSRIATTGRDDQKSVEHLIIIAKMFEPEWILFPAHDPPLLVSKLREILHKIGVGE